MALPNLQKLNCAFSSNAHGFLSTGIKELDFLMEGGIPRGQISEITGAPTAGKTSLLWTILAQATQQKEVVAYIDAFDALDPSCAANAGVDLQRLLWIRWAHSSGETPLKAADLLARAGGFGVIVLDLANVRGEPKKSFGKIPFNAWFRVRRMIEGTRTALLVLEDKPTAGSAAATVISLRRTSSHWSTPSGCLFRGIYFEVQLVRGKSHGHVSLYSHLQT